MKNFVQRGENITVTAPEPILSGALAKVGNLIGVASTDATPGDNVALVTVGVFRFPKVAADAFVVGDPVYLRTSDKLVSGTASGNSRVGIAVKPSPAGAAEVVVRLSGAL